jgi:hypothetical protein
VGTPKAKGDNPAKRPIDTIMYLGWGKLCMHGKFLNKKKLLWSY